MINYIFMFIGLIFVAGFLYILGGVIFGLIKIACNFPSIVNRFIKDNTEIK